MTIASEIRRIKTNISNAYAEAEEKGATLPVERNSDNLASTISTIQGGGGDKVLAQISAPMASPLAEGDKVWIEKNTGSAGAVYKHSGGVISAGSGVDYNAKIHKVGDVFTNAYTGSSSRTFYLAKYDKEAQKFYYGGSYSSNYFFYSINNKQRLKGITFPKYLNRQGFYYNGSSFTSYSPASGAVFTGNANKYYATSSSSDYAFCVDASATDPTTQKNWCIVKLGLENGAFSQEVTASGYTTDINVTQIETLFGTEDYCFARYGGAINPEQGSTVLKVDFINGTVEPYTFIGLGGTDSIQLRYIYEDQFVVTGDGLKYKITIDDSAKTITFTDGVVVENTPEVGITQINDCENIFYGSYIYYWVDNPTDFDTISFKKIYTVTEGVAGENYQPPVFATDNKLFCAGVLLSENGGVVDTDAITEPLSQIYFISDGGYVCLNSKVGKLGTGAFSYETGGSLSIYAGYIPMYWAYNGALFFRGNLSDSPQYSSLYISNSIGTVDYQENYLFSLSGNNYDTNRIYGKYWGCMKTGGVIVAPFIRELNEDGTYVDFTVTRCPWTPNSSSYDINVYWEGNDIYARVGANGALKGTIDWENRTIDWGESMYLTNDTRVQSKQILFTTYDGLYNISPKGIYEYNKETCQYLLKSSWPSDITTILGGAPTQVQVLNNKYINLSRYTRTVLIRYDDSGIENAEIVATFDAEDYTGTTIPTSSNALFCWVYSYNREYLSFRYENPNTSDGKNICFKLGDSPYEYNAFKPSYTNLNSNWLTGKFTGTQGTDENGRRYVEVATVLPEEEST